MKRNFALFSIIIGLAFFVLAAFLVFQSSFSGRMVSRLPASMVGLPLTSSVEGEQALTELTQMHGKEFSLVDGWIGIYGSSRQAILWVAASVDNASSDRLLEAMRAKIKMGNTPFSPLGERQLDEGNRSIYELKGMGQKHFYFQSGKLLIWLAADEGIAQEAIRETLKFYP